MPSDGEILVTGASGGVGSIAVIILSELGYNVTAVTGKSDPDVQEMLMNLGAGNIVARSTLEGDPKPLAKETYAGAVDTVGGVALTNVLTMVIYLLHLYLVLLKFQISFFKAESFWRII